MTRAEEYRAAYHKLGLISEVIIANVIVGNYTWRTAYIIGNALERKLAALEAKP